MRTGQPQRRGPNPPWLPVFIPFVSSPLACLMQIRASQEWGLFVSPEVLTQVQGFFLCSLFVCFFHFYLFSSVQFSSITQLRLTLYDPMGCSMPVFPVHHQLPELIQTHIHQVSDAIQQSHPVVPFSSHLQFFPASGSFPVSQFFALGSQSIGVLASASVLSMNIQD